MNSHWNARQTVRPCCWGRSTAAASLYATRDINALHETNTLVHFIFIAKTLIASLILHAVILTSMIKWWDEKSSPLFSSGCSLNPIKPHRPFLLLLSRALGFSSHTHQLDMLRKNKQFIGTINLKTKLWNPDTGILSDHCHSHENITVLNENPKIEASAHCCSVS